MLRGGTPPLPLRAICQEVQDPVAEVGRQSQPRQLRLRSVGEDGVKHRAKINKEQPCIAPLLVQVSQSGLEGCCNSILCRSVSPVSKLVRVQ